MKSILRNNKSVFSYLDTLTTWHCPHSPTAHHWCSKRSISPARRAHTSKTLAGGLLLLARAGTDGRTPYRFIDPATPTMRAVPIISWLRLAARKTQNNNRKSHYLQGTARCGTERNGPNVGSGVCVCVFSRKICAKRRNWNELKERRSTAINSPRPFAFDVIANTHSLFSVDTLHNVRVAVGSSDSSEAQTSS